MGARQLSTWQTIFSPILGCQDNSGQFSRASRRLLDVLLDGLLDARGPNNLCLALQTGECAQP